VALKITKNITAHSLTTYSNNKLTAFSDLPLLVGWHKGHPTCKQLCMVGGLA